MPQSPDHRLAFLARHLAPTPQDADALIDLSDVVRNSRVGPRHGRSLDRLRLVVEALARRTSDREVRVYAIADRSLRHGVHEYPGPDEPWLLADWIEQGLVEEADDADEPLLALADVTGLPVVSDDDFKDFRLVHPWIQGDTGQFLGMRPAPDRAVALHERDMGVRSAADNSRKLEESDLKAHGLLKGRDRRPMTEIVKRSWRCPERGCTLYDTRRGTAVRLPYVRRDVPLCELHRTPLVDDGPRTAVSQLKLLVDDACVHRFTLDAGTTVVLGRAPGEGGITLYGLLPDPLLRRVSRRHVVATVDEDGLRLRNLSGYGTRLLRQGAKSWGALSDGTPARFQVNDVAELTTGVTLTRSARRYPAEIAAAWQRSVRRVPEGPARAATRRH
ncbi:FHA domain-containing protein [Streptomyces sp. NPDC048644]|uniref:FHA domain-containing protein n=1 Tax=Streptomyces sp. NPDC048644 TaxID=3365582 RepID=UPI0037228F39